MTRSYLAACRNSTDTKNRWLIISITAMQIRSNRIVIVIFVCVKLWNSSAGKEDGLDRCWDFRFWDEDRPCDEKQLERGMRKFLNLDRNRKREKKRKPSWEREKDDKNHGPLWQKKKAEASGIADAYGNLLTKSAAVLNMWTELCSDVYNFPLQQESSLFQNDPA